MRARRRFSSVGGGGDCRCLRSHTFWRNRASTWKWSKQEKEERKKRRKRRANLDVQFICIIAWCCANFVASSSPHSFSKAGASLKMSRLCGSEFLHSFFWVLVGTVIFLSWLAKLGGVFCFCFVCCQKKKKKKKKKKG